MARNMSSDTVDQIKEAAKHEGASKKKWYLGPIGNFSIQYNFVSASIAVRVLSSGAYLGSPLYEQPGWSENVLLAIVFVGAMLGMLVMGRLGDVLGRARAMTVTTALAMLGALLPALVVGTPDTVYASICLGRLALGVGVGGIYPLSAAHSAECGSQISAARVGWAYFWQIPGVVVPYLVAMILFSTMGNVDDPPRQWVPQTQFRLLFAMGTLPAAVVFLAALSEARQTDRPTRPNAGSTRQALAGEPRETWRTLFGTSSAWFLYDVVWYGTNIFTPAILNDICMSGTLIDGTCTQTLLQTAWQSAIVALCGIPGCLVSVSILERVGSKKLNVYGFLLISVILLVMAIVFAQGGDHATLMFILFCLLTCACCGGPSVGTFVLPAICFPGHIRSTCHGFSAFAGKAGAVVGTLLFPSVEGSMGLIGVLIIQAVTAVLGALASQVWLKDDWEYSPAECCPGTTAEASTDA